MNFKDVKIIIHQCQYCEFWQEYNGCIDHSTPTNMPVEGCRCFKRKPIILTDEILKSDAFVEAASNWARDNFWVEPS